MRTTIRNGTVLAWQGERHEVLKRGEAVFEGNEITFAGEAYESAVDQVVDATGRLVIPGLINGHLHATDTPFTKGYLEDMASWANTAHAQNFVSLYKISPEVRHAADGDAQVVAAECAFAELARTGSTTVVELGYDYEVGGDGDIVLTERVADIAGKMVLRCYSGPRYRTKRYGCDGDGSVFYRDYDNRGRPRFEDCVDFCERFNGRYDDQLRTMLAPGQVDTCDADILEATRQVADRTGFPIQIHAGQSPDEYQRVLSTQGKTTVEYLRDTGLLGSDFIIGHGQCMTADGDMNSMSADEVAALRDSETSICHLPWVKARRGVVINSIQKYQDLGIHQCIGTDTYPFDLSNDMRFGAVVCKIVEASAEAALSEDVFRIATVGGAEALNRPDLGWLAVSCKADIVMVRIDTPKAAPVYDPFKFLVHTASGDDVNRVIVDGQTIVNGGEVLTLDVPNAVRRLNEASERVWARLDL